jgi:hypothetical protein
MKTNTKQKLLAAAGIAGALFQTSCKLPPGEVFRGLQREGLVGYFAKEHLENEIAMTEAPEAPEGAPTVTESVSDNYKTESSPFVSSGGERSLAKVIPGRPGFVFSPHSTEKLIVDVSDFAPGSTVMCPFTHMPFIVPSTNSNTVATSITREYSKPTPKPIYPNMDNRSSSPVVSATPKSTPKSSSTTSEPEISVPKIKSSEPESDGAIPYAKRIAGRPNYVYSPYASKSQIVDVTGMAAGAKVRCPFSGKLFRVPAESTGTSAPAPIKESAPAPKKEAAAAPKPAPKKEESAPAPKEVEKKPEAEPEPEPKKEEPKPSASPEPIKDASNGSGSTPTASWASGKEGYVTSPFGNFLVDVRGKASGTQVRCPFSGKLFIVPSK